MYVIIQGQRWEASVIGIVESREDVPAGILSQPHITVQQIPMMPEIQVGEFPWDVYIESDGKHSARQITIGCYQEETPWENMGTKYRIVIAKDEEQAIERALEEEC